METEELTRLVDEIYKNILDKFNPGARQLINAGKAYLKALHGAAAASRVYVDALSRLARQAQLGTWGGSKDVGFALMRIVEVYKEIQEQEMNILKAFYVDLLVPLETNLEKDTKVVQSEQKKFLQQHKTRSETYSKAAATMKKQRKKSRGASKSGLAMDKELKNMQILEEEKSKLDAFCEQSLKNAMTQERRRYGFVLERQCSLAKHYASFHEVALAALHPSVDKWREVAATREYLPQSVEDMFASRLRQVSFWPEEEENGGPELTMSSQLRKTRSMDSSCLELRLGSSTSNSMSTGNHGPPSHLPSALSRARSEANLHASTLSLGPDVPETPPRPRSMAPPVSKKNGNGSILGTNIAPHSWSDAPLARALFAYLSSGENQLSFLEGDLIALMGDRQKGWQFGENLRTQSSGWFPLAYTEIIMDDALGSPDNGTNNSRSTDSQIAPPCKPAPTRPSATQGMNEDISSGVGSSNMNTNKSSNSSSDTGTLTKISTSNSSYNLATPTARQSKPIRPSGTLPTVLVGNRRLQPPVPPVPPTDAVTSLHSSNDSGFSNEPPVQPDIDYSDDEATRLRRRKPRAERSTDSSKQHQQRIMKEVKSAAAEWENDSWKTIPKNQKSWHLYKTAMDLWAEANRRSNNENENEIDDSTLGRYSTNNSTDNYQDTRNRDHFNKENTGSSKKSNKVQDRSQKDYEPRSNRSGINHNSNHRNKYSTDDEQMRMPIQERRKNTEQMQKSRRQEVKRREQEETEDEVEAELEDEEEDNYGENYNVDKYGNKKYYENCMDDADRNSRHGYPSRNEINSKYNAKKTTQSSSSNSDDESTITIPETGRKVEHITQKLEQTAQKYAREHSPPKFNRKNNDYKTSERREEKGMHLNHTSYERYDSMSQDEHRASNKYDRESNYAMKSPDRESNNASSSNEKEKSSENDSDRNRQTDNRVSNRGFERPRPPSEEAPERPTESKRYSKERGFSDRETMIYGESRKYNTSNPMVSIDKERGYESNFETKLERTKVIERHGSYQKMLDPPDDNIQRSVRTLERNDTNNNTLKEDQAKRIKPLSIRQTTAMGHLIQTGRAYNMDSKSPKLIKRTKSFWRFRRDSDVLEGMALWQHRSLVDIPKMIKKENKEDKTCNDETKKTMTSETNSNSFENRSMHRKSDSDSTITNEHHSHHSHSEEPKPAERNHVPEKRDYLEDSPTPAERPKVSERSDYRMHRDERSYFVGNVSRKAILEKERKRSMEAKRNMVVAELKENNEAKRNDRRKKVYGDDDDGLLQNFTETEASDEESTYSCIIVNEQNMTEKTILPRTKLRRDTDTEKNTCGPWYDLWGVDESVNKKKKRNHQ